VEKLLAGKGPKMPPTLTPYIKAQRLLPPSDQMTLGADPGLSSTSTPYS